MMNERYNSRLRAKPTHRRLPSYFDLIDEENRRRGGGGAGKRQRADGNRRLVEKHMGAASALSHATGKCAVVVKVLSYGAGTSSARSVLAYQSTEEKARDQDGHEVTDINAAVATWEREFGNRKGSDDVLRLTYELAVADRKKVDHALRSLADDGFSREGDVDRTFAYSVSERLNGQTRLQFALVIAHEKKDRSDRSQVNRIAARTDNIEAIDRRLDSAMRSAGIAVLSRYPASFSSGPKGVIDALHALGRDEAEVTISTKTRVVERSGETGRYQHGGERRDLTATNHRELTKHGQLVGSLLQTRQPRDFMHLLLSGPANVDRFQFVLAGRDFLREQFAGHRYAYAVHNRANMQKHPHLHVIVALRNGDGRTLNPNIRDFTEWRLRFAEKARGRGIPIDRQKRIERAAPPPVKRWEWEMFQRMGATAPSNVIDKVVSKIRDTPAQPRREDAKRRVEQTRRSVGRVIRMLDDLALAAAAPSSLRALSQDLSFALRREHQRLETAVEQGRDPKKEKGQDNMLRSTPISAAQANAAKKALANTAVNVAAKIADPADRLIFEKATKIIGKVVGLQLDSRVVKNRTRPGSPSGQLKLGSLETKPTAGRDRGADNDMINKIANDRVFGVARAAHSDADPHEMKQDQGGKRSNAREVDRTFQKPTKLRLAKSKPGDRSR